MTVRTVTVFDVRLRSPRALRDAMTFRRYTVRSLADVVDRDLKRQKKRGVSHSLVGHLLTGNQKTTRPEVASSIESVLDVAPGALFETRVSNVQREVRSERGHIDIAAALMLVFGLAFVAGIWATLGFLLEQMQNVTEVATWLTFTAISGGA